ncbi:hypothetical protein ABPG74_022045 [Tetrahymena malaccensis]
MSSIQGGRQTQENSLPNKTKLIKRNVNTQLLKDKMAYFDIKTPNIKFAQLFEQTTEILNEIVKNQNIQNDALSQALQEIEKKIKAMNQERSRVQKELSEFAFGHILHMIDIYQNSDDLNHKYISFYLMKVWIKNFQYSEQYIDAMLASLDDNLSFQKEIFTFLQELSIEKPDVLDKILKIANSITSSFQGLINSDQEENQLEKKSVSGFTKGKSQEEFLEFILNILQKFESQELEKQLINIIQKYVPQNKTQYHKIILENFLNNEEIYEKYFSICIELIKKGFDEQDTSIILQYIKRAEAFYLRIKNSSRRGEFVKLLISNLLFLRQIKKQEISKPIRNLWKPTIFSDQEGQEKILEHQEEIISYLCSKFTSGEEETITMATDGLLEIMDKVIKDSTTLQSTPNNKKINYFQQILNGCLNNMQNQEKYFQLLSKFTDLLGLKLILQIQALVRLEWKSVSNLDINSINNYYQNQQIDLRAELQKFKQFIASSFFLFILNKKVMSKEIEQEFNQVENKMIGIYKMNHNILHGFLSQFAEIPQSKAILETNLYHYFKLEKVSQLKELEKYYGQDYIKNLISSYKGEHQAIVNYQTYLQQSSTIQNSQANFLQQEQNEKKTHPIKEYIYVSFDQKRQMFSHLNISTDSQAPQSQVSKVDPSQMEIEEQTKSNKVQEKHKPTHENNTNKNKQASNQKSHNQSQEATHQKNQHKTNQAQNPNSQAQSKSHHNKNQQVITATTKQSQDQQGQKDQLAKDKLETIEKQTKETLQTQEVPQQVQDESSQIQEEPQQVQEVSQQVQEEQQQIQEEPQQVQEERQQIQEQSQQNQESMQIENTECNKNQSEVLQINDLIIENQSQIQTETNIQKNKEQQIELKQQERELKPNDQKDEIQIKSSQILETKETQLTVAQEEKQQPQQDKRIQSADQQQEQMDIEENKQEEQKKQENKIVQTKDLSSSSASNNVNQKAQLPVLSIKKPAIQLNLTQSNQQSTSQTNQVSQKQPQTKNQELAQSESKEKTNTDQNNQISSQAQNQAKPKLSIKEKALLMMKNKQDGAKQNNTQTQEQIQQKSEVQTVKSSENLAKPIIGFAPTLEIKSQQQQKLIDQQTKQVESPDKQLSESKPSIDLTKKPSLLMMKKKQEQQDSSTPINQNVNTEKMEIEQSQSQQVTLDSSQNSEKIQQKPALSLKPKIQIQKIEKQENTQQKAEENTKKIDQSEQGEIEDLQRADVKQNLQTSQDNIDEKSIQVTLTEKKDEKQNSIETSNVIIAADQITSEDIIVSNNILASQQVNNNEDNALNVDANEEKKLENNPDKKQNNIDQVEETQPLKGEEEAQQIEGELQNENQQAYKKEEEEEEEVVVQDTQPNQELLKQNEEDIQQNQADLNEIEIENQGEDNKQTIQDDNLEIEVNEVLQQNQEEVQDIVNTIDEEDQQPITSQAYQDEQIQEEAEEFQVFEEQVEDITQEQTQKSQQDEEQKQLENEQQNEQQLEEQANEQDQDQGFTDQQEENEQANLEQVNEETKESNEEKIEEQN